MMVVVPDNNSQLTIDLNGGNIFDEDFVYAKIEIEKPDGSVFNLETGKKKESWAEQAVKAAIGPAKPQEARRSKPRVPDYPPPPAPLSAVPDDLNQPLITGKDEEDTE